MIKYYLLPILLTILCLILQVSPTSAQSNPALLHQPWTANWIKVPQTSDLGYGVYHFRKNIQLDAVPERFLVHLSADNRYKLYVNGQLVSLGPARGDRYYWNYESVDLSSWLHEGSNTLAAIVWNESTYRPQAQITLQTGFIMQGDGEDERIVDTNESWKCLQNQSYRPLPGIGYSGYYVSGPGELVDMNKFPVNWNTEDFDDSHWVNAANVFGWRPNGYPKGTPDASSWMLVPSKIPAMELTKQRFQKFREVTDIKLPYLFPFEKAPFQIPANTTATILLDQGFLTNAFMHLNFSQGADAAIRLSYAESLFEKEKEQGRMIKGNRNEVVGKMFYGRRDSIISNGTNNQQFSSLAWRTFRYVQMKVTTQDSPLTIDDIYNVFTGYPFTLNAKIELAFDQADKMVEIGWRTARLCAVETYMDCPYYEQLQYIGDTRIQALVSLYNSGDDRLLKNALNQMDHSRIAEGITLSRHPSYTPQIIPTFSLWYIGMLHDYWRYGKDQVFVKEKLEGVRQVLSFFSRFQQEDGSLRKLPYWVFTDWVRGEGGWDSGQPPYGVDGSSSLLDLQLLWAYQLAAELEGAMGMESFQALYMEKASQLVTSIKGNYWDETKDLIADTSDKKIFSQHGNSLAILTGVIKGTQAETTASTLLKDKSLTQASIYFKYYLHQALVMAGYGDDYLNWLSTWHESIDLGLTTWAEVSEISSARSDCHAWGSSPNIEFFRVVLGIDSDGPGFQKVLIKPHLGSMMKASGEIPHPNGKLKVEYVKKRRKWLMKVELPKGTTGKFVWDNEDLANAEVVQLQEGMNEFTF